MAKIDYMDACEYEEVYFAIVAEGRDTWVLGTFTEKHEAQGALDRAAADYPGQWPILLSKHQPAFW